MWEQPTGSVTLVFADIEGSTRLLHELGEEAYRDAVAEHRRIVRDAFSSRYEVDEEGDASSMRSRRRSPPSSGRCAVSRLGRSGSGSACTLAPGLGVLTIRLIARSRAAGRVPPVSGDPYGWEERVEAWEEVAASKAFLAIRDRIVELAGPRADDYVVDLGAGTGLLALELAPRVRELVAVDISERMLERLDVTAAADGIHNVDTIVGDLRRLPLEDESATLVVSNYAFHHLDDVSKELALAEARRILRPGGRLVICDMMFSLSLEPRDRRLIAEKIVALLKRGPAGVVRILRNAGRVVAGRWEQPAPPQTWKEILVARGFVDVRIELLEHEAAVAFARRPQLAPTRVRVR
jgi:ubiquinone/menaquinone biosynthesis C-methylase UbiE